MNVKTLIAVFLMHPPHMLRIPFIPKHLIIPVRLHGDVVEDVVTEVVVVLLNLEDPLKVVVKPQNINFHRLGTVLLLIMMMMREIPLISFQYHLLHLHASQAYILNTLYLGVPWKQLQNFLNYFYCLNGQ